MVYRIREGFQVSETRSKVIYESYLDFMEVYKTVFRIIKRNVCNIHGYIWIDENTILCQNVINLK